MNTRDIKAETAAIKVALRADPADSSHTPPRVLYHYTSAGGLRGILESKSIWLTDLRFMNDLSELQYAQALISDRATIFLQSQSSGNAAQNSLMDQVRLKDAYTFPSRYSMYSASFCESGNLLSQWRAYRGQGGGYALGIDVFHWVHLLDRQCMLKRVIYDRDVQVRLIDAAIKAYYDYLADPPSHVDVKDVVKAAIDELSNLFIHYLYSFKHPDFREEQEWRLVHFAHIDPRHTRSAELPKFRDFDGNLIPYFSTSFQKAIDASRDESQAQRFLFEEVVIGPTVNSSLNETSIKTMLLAINPDLEPTHYEFNHSPSVALTEFREFFQ